MTHPSHNTLCPAKSGCVAFKNLYRADSFPAKNKVILSSIIFECPYIFKTLYSYSFLQVFKRYNTQNILFENIQNIYMGINIMSTALGTCKSFFMPYCGLFNNILHRDS